MQIQARGLQLPCPSHSAPFRSERCYTEASLEPTPLKELVHAVPGQMRDAAWAISKTPGPLHNP